MELLAAVLNLPIRQFSRNADEILLELLKSECKILN